MARLVLVLLAWVLGASPAAAVDQAAIVARLTRDFAQPRYAALAEKSAALSETLIRFCTKRSVGQVTTVTTAFHEAADAWAAVSVLRLGPVETDLGYERLAHYPERNNAIAKALARLSDPATPLPAPEAFAGSSVAAQGFSALERVLFEPSAASLAEASQGRRCDTAVLVAHAIATRTAAIAAAWRADTVAGLPDSDREILARSVTDLLTLYKLIGDTRLSGVIGAASDAVKPRAGEMWRSGRASRIVALELAAAADLTDVLMRDASDEARSVALTARQAAEVARTMPAPIEVLAADTKRRSRVVLLLSTLRSARDLAAEMMPPALGITVGFNALDGD